MVKDYSAILTLENEVLKLNVLKGEGNDQSSGRSILEDDTFVTLLLSASKILKFQSLDEMLKTALKGDDLVYNFDQNIETSKYYDVQVVKAMYDKEVAAIKGKYESKVEAELELNVRSDFAAACLERACEVFAYKALNILKALAIQKLIIVSASLVNFERLINLFAKNSGILEINVEIK
jgi:hypothetical protein